MTYTFPICIFTAVVALVLLSGAAKAQLIPPPPVSSAIASGTTGGDFNESDRRMLRSINAYTRSIRAKLFPYQEEQNILELRQ